MGDNKLFLDFEDLLQNSSDWQNFYKYISNKLKIDGFAFQKISAYQSKNEIFLTYNLDQKFLSSYENKIKRNIYFCNYLKKIKENEVIDEKDLEKIENLDFEKSFKSFLKESQFSHFLFAGILNNFKENVIFISFRNKNNRPFSNSEKDFFKNISYLIKLIYSYCSEIEKKENYIETLKKTIEYEGKGIIILDNNLNVILLNKVAEIILSKKDGLEITKNGLEVTDPVISIQFNKKIKKMIISNSFHQEELIFAVLKRNKKIPMIIQLLPMQEKYFLNDISRKILVVLYDAEFSPPPNSSFLKNMFQFTIQERNIAILISKGLDLKEISDELKISLHTVRTHLKHIYSKTNTSRQAELMKLLLGLPKSI